MNNDFYSFVKKNGNLITTAQAVNIGVSKTTLTNYVAKGELTRVNHGIYALPDTVIDDMYVLRLRNQHIVFSHESALFLNGLSERTPFIHSITTPSNTVLPASIKKECACFYVRPKLFDMGLEMRNTTFGNAVYCYNVERTICDILRSSPFLRDSFSITAPVNSSGTSIYAISIGSNFLPFSSSLFTSFF